MTAKKKDIFAELSAVNVNEHLKKKGKLIYLSWTDALSGVLKLYPDTTWVIHEYPMMIHDTEIHMTHVPDPTDGSPMELTTPIKKGKKPNTDILVPFLETAQGCFVKVTVTIEGRERTEMLPILDFKNNSIPQPTAFDINTSIKRCLAKCLALHGLGLYIYRGEDLPDTEEVKAPVKPKTPVRVVKAKGKGDAK